MKVIHIFHSLKFSGAEIMYVNAAQYFQEQGCELTAMATGKELGEFVPYFEQAGYKIIHFPMPDLQYVFKRIIFYLHFINLIKKGKYDVIHIQKNKAMWGISLCARIAHIKSVYTFHNVYPTRILTFPYHFFIRWSAKYLFNCRFHTISDSVYDNELYKYYNKTTKIYNWFDNNKYYPATSKENMPD